MSRRYTFVKYDQKGLDDCQALREQFEHLDAQISTLPDGDEKNQALIHLEIAFMFVGKCIRNQVVDRTGSVSGGSGI